MYLRATNSDDSIFVTVCSRIGTAKGPASRATEVAMSYWLVDADQARWRAVSAPRLVAPVRNGAVFRRP